MGSPKEENSSAKLSFSKGCKDVSSHAVEKANTINSDIAVLHLFWGIKRVMADANKTRVPNLDKTNFTELEADLLHYTGKEFNNKRSSEKPKLTQSAKDALAIAVECAKQAGATEVTPSHLLSGIIRYVELIKQQQINQI